MPQKRESPATPGRLPAGSSRKRGWALTLSLLGGAALALLMGFLGTSWATQTRGHRSLSIGLKGSEVCSTSVRLGDSKGTQTRCRTLELARALRRYPAAAPAVSWGRLLWLWASMNVLLLVACAILWGLRSQSARIVCAITLFTLLAALLLGIVFEAFLLSMVRGLGSPRPGAAFFMYLLGCIAGILGTTRGWGKPSGPGASPDSGSQ